MLERLGSELEIKKTLKNTERGRVLLVRHSVSGNRYIFRDYEGGGEVYEKLTGLSSPYLPRVYEAAEENGRTAVLEEYIEGDTLFELLKGGLFSPAETKAVAFDICRALWVLHSLGAVHRDIKPENVILRESGAVLIDFDASRLVKAGAGSDTRVLGTTGFAAPEQYGISQTDCRADIYSLGVLMNVMLTGEHPSRKLAAGKFGRVIRRCTEVNPQKRYKNVLHLMEAIS